MIRKLQMTQYKLQMDFMIVQSDRSMMIAKEK